VLLYVVYIVGEHLFWFPLLGSYQSGGSFGAVAVAATVVVGTFCLDWTHWAAETMQHQGEQALEEKRLGSSGSLMRVNSGLNTSSSTSSLLPAPRTSNARSSTARVALTVVYVCTPAILAALVLMVAGAVCCF
jgi:hypothetical protein